jgi:NAD(P)-dependent dehydrogenase (short-subunit alcohol dehydrogenase family)
LSDRENRQEKRLGGQVAIVTGGSGGIGRAVSLALAAERVRVVIVGLTPEKVETVVEEVARTAAGAESVMGLALDVRKESDMERMVRLTAARFGQIDILITCAGLGGPSMGRALPYPVVQLPVEAWDEVIDTNLKGIFLSNRAVLPSMIARRGGQIINISSARGGNFGQPYASAYCASKFGVIGLSEALAEEVSPYGIRVQALLPDAVNTALLSQTAMATNPSDALPASTVAEFILAMLTLPQHMVVINPIIAPFKSHRRGLKRSVGENVVGRADGST